MGGDGIALRRRVLRMFVHRHQPTVTGDQLCFDDLQQFHAMPEEGRRRRARPSSADGLLRVVRMSCARPVPGALSAGCHSTLVQATGVVLEPDRVNVDASGTRVHMVGVRRSPTVGSTLVRRTGRSRKAANCERSARERSRDQPPHLPPPITAVGPVPPAAKVSRT